MGAPELPARASMIPATPISRRAFLRGAGTAAFALATQRLSQNGMLAGSSPFERTAAPRPQRIDDGTLFAQSVASGDPTPAGVMLWTRIAPEHFDGSDVWFEVASDEAFATIVASGAIAGSTLGAQDDYTVRVDADGLLQSDSTYYYRFQHAGTASRTGRCRTLPAADARPERVRFAVFSCSNYPVGHFNGYGLAADDDVDFVLHLGDWLYEGRNANGRDGRDIILPSGQSHMVTAEDANYVHSVYRGDKNLQRLLERHTLIPTWDDHEISNNRSYSYEQQRYYGSSNFSLNDDAEATNAFFLAAAKAYHDWMPIRVHWDPQAEHPFDALRLYRDFKFGDLAQLWMLDGRWYRSRHANQAREHTSLAIKQDGTMLGTRQLGWFLDGLREATTIWKFVGNQTVFCPLGVMAGDDSVYINMDAWDGYRQERDRITAAMSELDGNVVVASGDYHAFGAGYIQTEYGHTTGPSHRVGVEFLVSGLTSLNFSKPAKAPGEDEATEAAIVAGNPHMRHFTWSRNGYCIIELNRRAAIYESYEVDKLTDNLDAPRLLLRRYRVPVGGPEMIEEARTSPSGIPAPPVPFVMPADAPTASGVEEALVLAGER